MSILQYPDAIDTLELQVWNNAAFDNGGLEDSTGIKSSSWSQSLDSNSSKENISLVFEKSPVSLNSSVSSSLLIKPLHPNTSIANQLMPVSERGSLSKHVIQEESEIDMEIEEIEKEISRLSSRLETLRLEKAKRSLTSIEKIGKKVPAKFMEQKQSGYTKIEEPLLSSAKMKINRRGMSLGPAEIASGSMTRLLNKQEITPVSKQNRRKSCFWKLEEIDELKVVKERGKSMSVSPRSHKTVSKTQVSKHAATTVGSKRPVKKEPSFLFSIHPKTLFKDGEKSVPPKKLVKPGRVVASRYSRIPTNQQPNGKSSASEVRKRSLPEGDKEEVSKRRASRSSGVNQKTKKKWEIPSEVVLYKSSDTVELESPSSVSAMAADGALPKIKTLKNVDETPRDSGPVKRVADLVGRKSFFSTNEEEEEEVVVAGDSVCQTLSFVEEDAEGGINH